MDQQVLQVVSGQEVIIQNFHCLDVEVVFFSDEKGNSLSSNFFNFSILVKVLARIISSRSIFKAK